MANKLPLAIYTGKIKELAAADTIAYSKLNLTGSILNADLAGSIADGKLASSYLYADGTRPLTGNWAAGSFSLGLGVSPTYRLHISGTTNLVNFASALGTVATGSTAIPITLTVTGDFTDNTSSFRGFSAASTAQGSVAGSSIQALGFSAIQSMTANGLSIMEGVSGTLLLNNAGTVAHAYGFRTIANLSSSGSVTIDSIGFDARSPSCSSSGTIATAIGVNIEAQKGTGVTTGLGVNQKGTSDKNYFAGFVGVGTSTPTCDVQVTEPTTGIGTVSNGAVGTTVTGVGTRFTDTFKVGDTITIGAQTVAITAIASDTSMTTASITSANSGVAYTLTGGDRFSIRSNGNVGIGSIAPICRLYMPVAPIATANYGTVSIGNGAWDGATAGFFAGTSGSGTSLAINEAVGYAGNLIQASTGGSASFRFQVSSGGNIITSGTITSVGIITAANGRMTVQAGIFNSANGAVATTSGKSLELLADAVSGRGIMILTTTGFTGILNTAPTSALHTTSFATAYVSKALSYTATSADHTIEVTATGQTITLPTAVGITGREYIVKLTAAGSCTVNTTSSQTIDGSTTYSLSAQYKYVKVQSNNANWLIIGNN